MLLGNSYSWLCDSLLEGVSGVTSVHIIDVNAGVILARRGIVGDGDDRQKGSCVQFLILSQNNFVCSTILDISL